MTLTEFLTARIAEDEAPTFELIPYTCEPGCCAPALWVGHRCLICDTEEFGGTVEAITRIAREHDKQIHRRSRALDECHAKRRVVELHQLGGSYTPGDDQREGFDYCATCGSGEPYEYPRPWPCDTVRALAAVYAAHPDYDPAWAL